MFRFDLKDLQTALLRGHGDLDVHLESTGAQHGLVDEVLTVSHCYEKNVVELFGSVDLREELVDSAVMHTCVVAGAATLLDHGVELVEHDDVKTAVLTLAFGLCFGSGEQFTDVRLRLTHVLVKQLRAVHEPQVLAPKHRRQSTCDERLASAGRTIQQHTLDVTRPHLADDGAGVQPGLERTTEDLLELLAETADARRLEVEPLREQLRVALLRALRKIREADGTVLALREQNSRVGSEETTRDLGGLGAVGLLLLDGTHRQHDLLSLVDREDRLAHRYDLTGEALEQAVSENGGVNAHSTSGDLRRGLRFELDEG
eukprot:PhM_4_TR8881/c0_g1_i1/m.100897